MCTLLHLGFDVDDEASSSLTEFRWHGQDDVVQYVAADAADPFIVQSLLTASFSKDGVFVIGNWFAMLFCNSPLNWMPLAFIANTYCRSDYRSTIRGFVNPRVR